MKTFPTHIVAVAGVIENEKGEVLLVRHKKDDTWGIPGGQVENGENLIEALTREIEEETGADIIVNRLFWVGSNVAAHAGSSDVETVPTKVIFNFTCTYIGGELRPQEGEIAEIRWTEKSAAYYYLSEIWRDRYQAYLDFDGTVRYQTYTSRPYVRGFTRHI